MNPMRMRQCVASTSMEVVVLRSDQAQDNRERSEPARSEASSVGGLGGLPPGRIGTPSARTSGTELRSASPSVSAGAGGRQCERGVTLFEVLIVVAILAMVAGGVAVFALPKYREAQISSAETGARVIRTAVQNWQAGNNETTCPTISQLVQEKHLDPGQNTNDSWGQAYVLQCTDDDVVIISSGPDKKKGTKDDIRVPKVASPTGEGG
jgi:general secretion pathway protein G